MRDSDPFRELLESLEEGDWTTIDEEDDNGNGQRGGFGGGDWRGGSGSGPQGNPRLLWWIFLPFLLLILFNWGLGFYTDWIWYDSLDLSSVFFTRIGASVGLFLAGGLVFWLFLAFNVLLARRLEPEGLVGTPISQIANAIGVRLTPVVLIIGAVFAFFMGTAAASAWEEVLLYVNQTAFNIADPVFNNDVGFYIFTLPVWQIARNWLLSALVLTLIGTALVSGIGWRSWNASAAVRAHLSGLGALILLLIAWQYRLDALQLVYSARGAVLGAGYTDIHAQLPAYNLLTIVTLITAVLLLVNVFLRQAWRAIVIVLVIWVGVAVLAGNVYPNLVQRFQVSPNEFTLEEPYINNNIEFTRLAYDLDNVEAQDYKVATDISADSLVSEASTIRNIRLWDYRPLKQTYNQIQALRQYYEFQDIDVDRYSIDGDLRQVMLSARELVPERLASEAQTWVNRKLVYTHGYGVAASPVAQITQDGLPDFLLKDLPPQGVLPIDQPQIYFGERTNDYVIVRTNTPEFDYPQEGGNVFSSFEGEAGIPIGSYLSRLAFSLRFADVNILLTDAIQPDSRLLWRRNIMQRVFEVAPFLHYDNDPYIVLADGKLYWMLDAYTTSNLFPYSSQLNWNNTLLPQWRLNYIRNSVKVVIDAYSGDMKFYVVDPNEPIIAAYNQIFPALFTPMSEMPESLLRHIRYPTTLFSIQAELFRTYHMTDTNEFYNREDLWQWPQEFFNDRSLLMEPYYVLMELPGREQGLNFIQILPFTPANRENMIAWLAARSDPDHYGEKIVYEFGKDTLFYGPKQIEARIDQDPVISSQLSLWNQQGSQVIRGNLLVIPVGNGLLYVEPLYLQAADGKIPELKRVILATSNKVVMAQNLGLGLADLFGRDILNEATLAELVTEGEVSPEQTAPSATPSNLQANATLDELILQANQLYNQAQESLRNGDWTQYGTQIDALQSVLEQLATVAGVEPPPQPGQTTPPTPSAAEGTQPQPEPTAESGS